MMQMHPFITLVQHKKQVGVHQGCFFFFAIYIFIQSGFLDEGESVSPFCAFAERFRSLQFNILSKIQDV